MATAKVKASMKYNEKNVKQIKLALNKKTDADIIKILNDCGNIQGYIKHLIRKDIYGEDFNDRKDGPFGEDFGEG